MNIMNQKYVRLLLIFAVLLASITPIVSVAAQGSCDTEVSDAVQLTAAINRANDEAACAGLNTIRLLSYW